MKKFFYMAVAAIAALSSCGSDDAILNEGGQNETGVTTFTATIEDAGVTRATYNATSKKAEWVANTDKIKIGNAEYTAATTGATTTFTGITGATKGADNKYHAYFPATVYNGITATLPASYTYTEGGFDMPMYAESSTTELSFKNLCGVLAITVPQSVINSVTSIVVSSDKQMNGEISSITESGVLTFATPGTLTDALKKVTLTASAEVSIPAGGKTFYVPVPANTHNPLTITVSNSTTTKIMTTKKSGGVAVERSKIYPITFDDHLVPGPFSVSATKTVRFTKSNLYWSSSDNEFHFESKPTDYPTTRATTHVSHFFWTNYTDYLSGDAAKMPYAASFPYSAPSWTGLSATDEFWCSENHKITVDGVSNLYILSAEEWVYLLNTRTNHETLKKHYVTVNGKINCLIIAPDNYSGTIKSSYTLDELNAAGLVCLPAAGRFEDSVVLGGAFGLYWTSSPNTYNDQFYYARYLLVYSAKPEVPNVGDYRKYGLSLRAVVNE